MKILKKCSDKDKEWILTTVNNYEKEKQIIELEEGLACKYDHLETSEEAAYGKHKLNKALNQREERKGNMKI